MWCMDEKALQDQIDRFLCSREYDLLFRDWPGQHALERIERGHDALMDALVREMKRREDKVTCPASKLPDNLTSFSREKLGPMVRGLFPRREWAPVLAVLEKSVVFLAPNGIESVVREARDLETAWEAANIYLWSIGGAPLNPDERRIVGFSVETTCYVSIEYFADKHAFSDYVVHEAAHIFHNTKRVTLGLPITGRQEWLLPIDFVKRETFAYAAEAYSRIIELSKTPAERRLLAEELVSHPLPSEEFVDRDEYLNIISEAVRQRNGWKVILRRCEQDVSYRRRRSRRAESNGE